MSVRGTKSVLEFVVCKELVRGEERVAFAIPQPVPEEAHLFDGERIELGRVLLAIAMHGRDGEEVPNADRALGSVFPAGSRAAKAAATAIRRRRRGGGRRATAGAIRDPKAVVELPRRQAAVVIFDLHGAVRKARRTGSAICAAGGRALDANDGDVEVLERLRGAARAAEGRANVENAHEVLLARGWIDPDGIEWCPAENVVGDVALQQLLDIAALDSEGGSEARERRHERALLGQRRGGKDRGAGGAAERQAEDVANVQLQPRTQWRIDVLKSGKAAKRQSDKAAKRKSEETTTRTSVFGGETARAGGEKRGSRRRHTTSGRPWCYSTSSRHEESEPWRLARSCGCVCACVLLGRSFLRTTIE